VYEQRLDERTIVGSEKDIVREEEEEEEEEEGKRRVDRPARRSERMAMGAGGAMRQQDVEAGEGCLLV
jgi:hypothetical protein